ncbi:prolipodiacylglyceryl transferase family protein [Mycobacterium kansasii 732]|nr:prolipodiacylglyceryl transferase family protein [Mycobacterium kansasii 732]
MTTTWLAYIPSPPRGVWHLGPLPIRAYALFIITGIIVALLIGDRRFAARGGERGVIYDIALWMVPFGLIGGRLYHLATDWRTYFGHGGAGFAAALRIWDGGLGIWGAIALGAVGAWIACRRRGIPLPAFLDAAAPESFWRRLLAGSEITSIKNSTAARPQCRGDWRSSTGAIPPDSSTFIPLTVSRPGSSRSSCTPRSSTNCCGTY